MKTRAKARRNNINNLSYILMKIVVAVMVNFLPNKVPSEWAVLVLFPITITEISAVKHQKQTAERLKALETEVKRQEQIAEKLKALEIEVKQLTKYTK